jgi:glycosyltransferase involved in cell wall biosynthesis
MAECHAFALISNWEGFPRTTLEAMRAGLPVVVSDVGGASEAVGEGVTGFKISRGDVDGLRQRLRALTNDPILRKEMGQAARKLYESEFSFDHMFRQTVRVYKELLEK